MKNILLRTNILLIALSLSLFIFPQPVLSEGFNGAAMPTSCGDPSQLANLSNAPNVCFPNYTGGKTGRMLFGTGAKFEISPPAVGYILGLLNGAFPPYVGDFRQRTFVCPMQTAGKCTMKQSSGSIISAGSVFFPSTSSAIGWMSPRADFGGSGQYFDPGTSFSVCITIVDSQNIDWRSDGEALFCADARVLPTKPATCYLNYDGSDLNVDLGSLERGMIATQPLTTTPTTKQVQVLCTPTAGVNLTMEFQYTPLTINGTEVVGTSTPGLGVAVIYQGKVVSPTDKFQLAYTVGYNQLDLDFEAIRDPSVNIGDIAAGPFTAASLVVVMTEQ